jgi:DNA polymerase III epsilon subunit
MAREIVLDTETTGFEPTAGHRLVEIACLEIEDFIPTGRSFHTYIDPCRDVPVDAERVHGLSTAFLTGKPRFEHAEVVDAFLDFVGDAPIIAHNAGFDRHLRQSRTRRHQPRGASTKAAGSTPWPWRGCASRACTIRWMPSASGSRSRYPNARSTAR